MAATILIAEDEPRFRYELGRYLEQQGYRVICVEDGWQAVEYAVREKPDLFVLDVHMPAGDGFSVEERLHRLPEMSLKPVIFMTRDKSAKIEIEARDHHAVAFFHKPFIMHELLQVVREVLGKDAAGSGAEAA